jgi:tRNA(fMet)-specific endonuclease VapC
LRFLLDTNACIQLLRRGKGASIRKRLEVSGVETVVCSIVRSELVYGALRSERPEHNLDKVKALLSPFQSLPFDDAAAQHAADIRASLTGRGKTIGPYDILIAAIARANGLAVVTHNVAEFSRIAGLQVDDWEA